MSKNAELEALLLLQEECAEVIHIANKSLRFGLEDFHPHTGVKNREALVQEIGDVMALVDILKGMGIMNDSELEIANAKKREKLKTWSSLLKEESGL